MENFHKKISEITEKEVDLNNHLFCEWLAHSVIVTGNLRYGQLPGGRCCAIVSLNSHDSICEVADQLSDGDTIAESAAEMLLKLVEDGFTWIGIDDNPLIAIDIAVKKAFNYWFSLPNK